MSKIAKYLNLAIGASARLAVLRKSAATMNAAPYRRNADPLTWRDVRYANLRTYVSVGHGFNDFNGKTPVLYSHDGQVFPREVWADEVEYSGIDHTGWYADPDHGNKMRGFIVRLPHGRYMAGYESSDNGERVYFLDLYDDERDAASAADSAAQYYAEAEYDHQTRYREAQAIRDAIDDVLTGVAKAFALRNHPRFKDTQRDACREMIEEVREKRETLKTEYADIDF